MGKRENNTPVKLILDTDMLTDCDDAAALAMLHTMADNNEVEILAAAVSSRYPMSAPVVDAINTYYRRATIPVGAPKHGSGAFRNDSRFLDEVAAEFPHEISCNEDAVDAVALYRKVLSDVRDNSANILTIGYMSNLELLLKSPPDVYSRLDGIELVDRKVEAWVCMGGNFPVDDATHNVNFTRDCNAAVYAIRNWPGDITFVGREIGHNIFVGEKLKQTADANPVKLAYKLHRERAEVGHWNHHTADPCAVLYAVRGLGDYFEISPDGHMYIEDDCSFVWRQEEGGNHKYLIQKMDRGKMAKIMEDLIVAPPAHK